MQRKFFLAIGLSMGLFAITNGVLLILSPKHFLKFHDVWARGDWVGRTAPWREDVGKTEYKILGLLILAVGIMILWDMISRIAGLR